MVLKKFIIIEILSLSEWKQWFRDYNSVRDFNDAVFWMFKKMKKMTFRENIVCVCVCMIVNVDKARMLIVNVK